MALSNVGERLTFNHGVVVADRYPTEAIDYASDTALARPTVAPAAVPADPRPDVAFWSVFAFTALLFIRPQDTFRLLEPLHLSDVAAMTAALALLVSRLSAGQPLARLTPELAGVSGLAVLMLAGAPFSIWPGGAINTLLDVYLKVALVFFLLTQSVRSPVMLRRLMWLVVMAVGYVALRGALDYARGENLVRGNRLQGAVSGLLGNPNDLAMNMVTFLPFAVVAALGRGKARWRLAAGLAAALMAAAVVLSRSRAGMLGFAVMAAVPVLQSGRLRSRLVIVLLLGSLVAIPLLPAGTWTRLSSIVVQEEDETGSRESRKELMLEGWETFLQFPITGVGAGQFKNYNPPDRTVPWQETHNVILQLLADLGIAGGLLFIFLIACAVRALIVTRRMLRVEAWRRRSTAARARPPALDPADEEWMRGHVSAAAAALAGWVVCAQFASIGYYWTFYYLLAFIVVAREIVRTRVDAVQRASDGSTGRTGETA